MQQEFRKHYKTLTRTRQFYVDGTLVVSQTSKVIAVEDEDEKRKELDKWYIIYLDRIGIVPQMYTLIAK
jgi:hypothetical protein